MTAALVDPVSINPFSYTNILQNLFQISENARE